MSFNLINYISPSEKKFDIGKLQEFVDGKFMGSNTDINTYINLREYYYTNHILAKNLNVPKESCLDEENYIAIPCGEYISVNRYFFSADKLIDIIKLQIKKDINNFIFRCDLHIFLKDNSTQQVGDEVYGTLYFVYESEKLRIIFEPLFENPMKKKYEIDLGVISIYTYRHLINEDNLVLNIYDMDEITEEDKEEFNKKNSTGFSSTDVSPKPNPSSANSMTNTHLGGPVHTPKKNTENSNSHGSGSTKSQKKCCC